jgi:hypothetical protein
MPVNTPGQYGNYEIFVDTDGVKKVHYVIGRTDTGTPIWGSPVPVASAGGWRTRYANPLNNPYNPAAQQAGRTYARGKWRKPEKNPSNRRRVRYAATPPSRPNENPE